MSSDQHDLERDKTDRQKSLENQEQSSIVEEEEEEEDDPFAEFAWVTGHDVDTSDEDNGNSDGSVTPRSRKPRFRITHQDFLLTPRFLKMTNQDF